MRIEFKNLFLVVVLLLSGGSGFAQLTAHWETRSPMPVRRSNMAATAIRIGDTTFIYCFMGMDSTKVCGGSMRLESWKYNTTSDQWSQVASVPDTEGRIAANATALDGKIYLVGGYKVFGDCSEFTSPRVDIYDPVTDTWSLGDSMPKRVDDHVQVLWRDSLIYTISGWSQTTNTLKVQFYNPAMDTWTDATPISGPGLFGHAGSIREDTIIYIDGVRVSGFSFVLVNAVWKGVIDRTDPTNITWTSLGMHPGDRIYRTGGFTYGNRIIFTGGTDNAYNFDGIGYNSIPSVETGRTFGYNLKTASWEEYVRNPDSVMDVREVVQVGTNQFYVIGGMSAGQEVTNKVSVFVIDSPANVNEPDPTALPQLWYDATSRMVRIDQGIKGKIEIFDLLGRKLESVEIYPNDLEYMLMEDLYGLYLFKVIDQVNQNESIQRLFIH